MKDIQKRYHLQPFSPLISLKQSLQQDYHNILLKEGEFWSKKSRINWLNFGDANTNFFHTFVIMRRKLNRIFSLKNSVGEWISNETQLLKLILDHFKQTYTKDFSTTYVHCLSMHHHIIPSEDHPKLIEPLCEREIILAVKSFIPFMAPGPNGF